MSRSGSRIIFSAAIGCVLLLLVGRAAITVRDAELSDFRCFYEAARLIGTGQDPYDHQAWAAVTKQDPSRLPPCPETFHYPLWTAAVMAPLAVFSEPTALAAWELVLLSCVLAGVALLARTWRLLGGAKTLLLLVLCSEPMFSAIANAQIGPVVFLGLAAVAFSLERRHVAWAAAAWSLMLIKPNIVALALVGLPALMRSRRFAGYVLLDGAAITIVTLAMVPTWPVDVVREILGQQLLADRDLGTLSAMAMVVGLPSQVGLVGSIVAVAVFAAALPRRRLRPREIVAVLVVGSFLLTPYARPHDEVALAVCWSAALAQAGLGDPAQRRWVVGAVVFTAFVLPWSVTIASLMGAPLALHVITTLCTAALLVYALRRSGTVAAIPLASPRLS